MSLTVVADRRVLHDVEQRLKEFEKPAIDRVLLRAARAAGNVFVRPLRAEARKLPHANPADPASLANKVRVSRVRRGEGGIATVAGPFSPHAHLVIEGTQARTADPKNVRVLKFTRNGETVYAPETHPGPVKPNPFVARVGEQYRDAARAKAVQTIVRAAEKRR